MSLVVEIDVARKFIVSVFSGEVSERDFREAVELLPLRPGFDPGFSHVIDFTKVSAFRLTPGFIRGMSQRPSVFDPNARQVVVAPQNHVFGLARMAQIVREQQTPNLEVVRSREIAYRILGIHEKNDE